MPETCAVCREPLDAPHPYFVTKKGPTCLGCVLEHDIDLGLERAREQERELAACDRQSRLLCATPLLLPVEESLRP